MIDRDPPSLKLRRRKGERLVEFSTGEVFIFHFLFCLGWIVDPETFGVYYLNCFSVPRGTRNHPKEADPGRAISFISADSGFQLDLKIA